MALNIKAFWGQLLELDAIFGVSDEGGPLRKAAACAIIDNPFANRGYVADLSELVEGSSSLGSDLGRRVAALLGGTVTSYGKAALVGSDGEQEHGNALLTSRFGDALRGAVGGGEAWISSVTKVGGPGDAIDVPLAFKDDIWVRSHYDALEVRVPGSPRGDEILVIAAAANRGRLNARLGGRSLAEAEALLHQ